MASACRVTAPQRRNNRKAAAKGDAVARNRPGASSPKALGSIPNLAEAREWRDESPEDQVDEFLAGFLQRVRAGEADRGKMSAGGASAATQRAHHLLAVPQPRISYRSTGCAAFGG